MTTKSSNGSPSFENCRDYWSLPIKQTSQDSPSSSYELQQPGRDIKAPPPETNPSWRSLFAFTTWRHVGPIAGAVIASIFAGLVRPVSAIIFGRIFNALTNYGAGTVDAKGMLDEVSTWCIGLTVLGAATWIAEGAFFSLWLVFGELQAKSVRQQMFSDMLDKSMEWYDLREDGIASLLSRIET